jgi:predicted Rossmann fold nucleotide-binding protein DprA/Smf involved in DNA uptake
MLDKAIRGPWTVPATSWIHPGDPAYPSILPGLLGNDAPPCIAVLGDLTILDQKSLALFCSVKCPGNLVLQTYDLAQRLRQSGVTVIGGFHSPMEQECLTILLRGTQPVIVCPARSLSAMRIPAAYKQSLQQGRMLLLSPFADQERRATVETAMLRNRFVASVAGAIFVAHAEPQSKTERFCCEVLALQKPLYTLAGHANGHLLTMGATPLRPDDMSLLVG